MKIKGRKNYKPGPKDECASPCYAVMPLMKSIFSYSSGMAKPNYDFVIWEPATGMMKDRLLHIGLVSGFRRFGYKVFAPVREDFIEADFQSVNERCYKKFGRGIDLIATNPPFSVALKRRFINHCESIYEKYDVPYALLMNTTTLVEKTNGRTLRGCALHIPNGRISFGMPQKGWGTRDKPTKATFTTNWFSKGIVDPFSIHYDDFDMSDHYDALERFTRL